MFSDTVRLSNVLTAGTPLRRLTVCGIIFIREGARGELVQVPQCALDEGDRQVIEAQQDPPPTDRELSELYLTLNGWTKQDFGGWTNPIGETDHTFENAIEIQDARDCRDEAVSA